MSSITIAIEGNERADESSAEDQQLAADILMTWKGDPKIRAEFGDNLTVYQAYRKAAAAGRVRVLGRRDER